VCISLKRQNEHIGFVVNNDRKSPWSWKGQRLRNSIFRKKTIAHTAVVLATDHFFQDRTIPGVCWVNSFIREFC
jgi:hypothetical protein